MSREERNRLREQFGGEWQELDVYFDPSPLVRLRRKLRFLQVRHTSTYSAALRTGTARTGMRLRNKRVTSIVYTERAT